MSLVKSLLRREDRFSSLLEASAAEVQANVKALEQLLTGSSPAVSLKAFLQTRAREQEIKAEIDALLCQGRGTALDHADIEALARALVRIVKSLRKFAERYLICAGRVRDVPFTRQIQMLTTAADTLHQMVVELGSGRRVARTKDQNDALQKVEQEADQQFVQNMASLYQGRHEPMKSLMLKDLYEELDRAFDRCRSAGDLILQIVLKLS